MNDLISRQDAIDAVHEHMLDDGDICWQGAIDIAIDELRALPSAEPERKMSRWGYMLIDGSIMCLNCGTRYDWDSQAQYYKYCPNCGSRMMEANQDE